MNKGQSSNHAPAKGAAAAADDAAKAEANNKFVSATVKRIRALRKKMRLAEDLRNAKAAGTKTLDEAEEGKVASLPVYDAAVQELDNLRSQLMDAWHEEEKEKAEAEAIHAAELATVRAQLAACEAECARLHESLTAEREARLAAQAQVPTVPIIDVATANAEKAAAAAAASAAASKATKATSDSEWNHKVNMLLRALHLGYLLADTNAHAAFNKDIIAEHFGGSASESDLGALKHLGALLIGAAPTFGDDMLPPDVFAHSNQSLQQFFAASSNELVDGVTYNRLWRLVGDSSALLILDDGVSDPVAAATADVSASLAGLQLSGNGTANGAPRGSPNKRGGRGGASGSKKQPRAQTATEVAPAAVVASASDSASLSSDAVSAPVAAAAAPVSRAPRAPKSKSGAQSAASVTASAAVSGAPSSEPVATVVTPHADESGAGQTAAVNGNTNAARAGGRGGRGGRGGSRGNARGGEAPAAVAPAPVVPAPLFPQRPAAIAPPSAQEKTSFAKMVSTFKQTGAAFQ